MLCHVHYVVRSKYFQLSDIKKIHKSCYRYGLLNRFELVRGTIKSYNFKKHSRLICKTQSRANISFIVQLFALACYFSNCKSLDPPEIQEGFSEQHFIIWTTSLCVINRGHIMNVDEAIFWKIGLHRFSSVVIYYLWDLLFIVYSACEYRIIN